MVRYVLQNDDDRSVQHATAAGHPPKACQEQLSLDRSPRENLKRGQMPPKPFSFTQFAKNAPANPLDSHTFKTKDLKPFRFTHFQKSGGGRGSTMPSGPSMMRPGEFSRRRAMKKTAVWLGVTLAAMTMIPPVRAQQAPPLEELKKAA